MDYIWLIVLFVLGLLMIMKPELLWKIEHLLSVKDGAPSDLYLSGMRLGGVLFSACAVGIFLYVLAAG